jgi:eukaryotic-like serine/threonine-protein kinase
VTDALLDNLTRALGEAYTIERELTGGGMSRVFVAREHALGREVVIKVLPPELSAGINRERFRREVQLAARLSHPYIVPLLHAGEAGELLWFTMPYIPGESLRARLERDGPLPVREVVQYLRDVVEALAYAHGRGVIHRDIKPANILSDGPHAVVTDFGVAKALGASLPMQGVAGHTTSGIAIGTPAYMAPEQLAADPAADHRVDIYAVGLLAYELLTGASPFAAPSPTATMTAQLTRTPDPIRGKRADVPVALSALVDRCLAKEPEGRPADAQQVLVSLDQVSGELAADRHRASTTEMFSPPRPASRVPLAVAGVMVVALLAVGAWYARQGTPVAAAPAAPETVVVAGGADSASGAALPAAKRLTRADSLAIASALRDELERLDPQAAARVPRPSATPAAPTAPGEAQAMLSLERQLATTDSIVRARLAEIARRGALPMPPDSMARLAEGARAAAGAAVTVTRVPIPSGPRRVIVLAGTGRTRDPALESMSQAIAAELKGRLARNVGWTFVTPEREPRPGEPLQADVLVSMALVQATPDSVQLRVGVRNLEPGSSFGFRVLSSDRLPLPVSPESFRETMREVYQALEALRRTPRGEVWQMDMGRTRSEP